MALTLSLSSLILLGFATASLADHVPFYTLATPTPAAGLPNLEAHEGSTPNLRRADDSAVLASCSTAVKSYLPLAPSASPDLLSWIDENKYGKCGDIRTGDIPASLTAHFSSLQSQISSVNCGYSSLLEVVWSTCADLPQFTPSLGDQLPEGCLINFACPTAVDVESDDDTVDKGAASRLRGLGAAAAAVVAGSIALAAFQL